MLIVYLMLTIRLWNGNDNDRASTIASSSNTLNSNKSTRYNLRMHVYALYTEYC